MSVMAALLRVIVKFYKKNPASIVSWDTKWRHPKTPSTVIRKKSILAKCFEKSILQETNMLESRSGPIKNVAHKWVLFSLLAIARNCCYVIIPNEQALARQSQPLCNMQTAWIQMRRLETRPLIWVQAVWHSDNIFINSRNIGALWNLKQTRNIADEK